MGVSTWPQLDKEQLTRCPRSIRMIFQDPYASLNPRMTLQEIVGAPLRAMGIMQWQRKSKTVWQRC